VRASANGPPVRVAVEGGPRSQTAVQGPVAGERGTGPIRGGAEPRRSGRRGRRRRAPRSAGAGGRSARVGVRRLGHGPDRLARARQVALGVSVDGGGGVRRADAPEEPPPGRRLARTVGPDEPGDRLRLGRERPEFESPRRLLWRQSRPSACAAPGAGSRRGCWRSSPRPPLSCVVGVGPSHFEARGSQAARMVPRAGFSSRAARQAPSPGR
jgi:hypothetical protein